VGNPVRANFSYDSADQFMSITRYGDLNGLQGVGSTAFRYDNAGRVTQILHSKAPSTPLATYVYGQEKVSGTD
jgi:hypothetical protein